MEISKKVLTTSKRDYNAIVTIPSLLDFQMKDF